MPNYNSVTLIGTLTRDPEVKFLPTGKAVAGFALAINSTWKTDSGEKREDVTFVECEAWGRTAEIIGEHFKKGHPIFVTGRLKQDAWDDKTTGQKRSKTKVVVDGFQFLKPAGTKSEAPQGNAPARDPDLDPVADDDIPY